MEKTNQKTLEEIIRVDHAGERGAIKIYEGQLIALKTFKQDEEAGLLCRLHDISVHGFILRTGPIFELGLKVRTILPIAGNPLPIIAECIRYNEPEEKKGLWQYGFKFKYVSPKERSMIFQFITQQHVIAKRRLERDLWDWGLI